ncbi:MAG: murein biosynthesis integral membrane protein MurJ [Solirubrobacteraceae bacterium]
MAADPEDVGAAAPAGPEGAVAAASATVAAWTLVSRASGFARVAVVAAALGATYLGNTFAATNYIPNLVLEMVTGSLLSALLVPALVRTIDGRDARATERLAGGYLSLILIAFTIVALLGAGAAPVLLKVFVAGVSDRRVAADQFRVGWILLAMQMFQIPLYGVIQVGAAVQNAHRRFALAAAAPVVENLGTMAVIGAFVALYGTSVTVSRVTNAQLLLLGLGSTAAVGWHAAIQWWGARRAGVLLLPRPGWRDPEVLVLLRRARSALGQSSLSSGRTFVAVAVANSVPGGVVALQVGLNFLWLPVMVFARPVAVAFQPLLSRLHHQGREEQFEFDYHRALSVVIFVAVPAMVWYAALAEPLARIVSYGQFSGVRGVGLVSAALIGLAAAVLGESLFLLSNHAAFARDDVRSPFLATALATTLTIVGLILAAALTSGRDTLLASGGAFSLGSVAAAWLLAHRVGHRPAAERRDRLLPAFLRSALAGALMALPTYAVGRALSDRAGGHAWAALALLAAALAGGGIFLALQRLLRAPELGFFRGAGSSLGADLRPGGDARGGVV